MLAMAGESSGYIVGLHPGRLPRWRRFARWRQWWAAPASAADQLVDSGLGVTKDQQADRVYPHTCKLIEQRLYAPSPETRNEGPHIGRKLLADLRAACPRGAASKIVPPQLWAQIPHHCWEIEVLLYGVPDKFAMSRPGYQPVNYSNDPDKVFVTLTIKFPRVETVVPELSASKASEIDGTVIPGHLLARFTWYPCDGIRHQLYNYRGSGKSNPALSPKALAEARNVCPERGGGASFRLPCWEHTAIDWPAWGHALHHFTGKLP